LHDHPPDKPCEESSNWMAHHVKQRVGCNFWTSLLCDHRVNRRRRLTNDEWRSRLISGITGRCSRGCVEDEQAQAYPDAGDDLLDQALVSALPHAFRLARERGGHASVYERHGFPDDVRWLWSLYGVVLTRPPGIHTDAPWRAWRLLTAEFVPKRTH
jgi:hypothetical protein